jgi:DNA-directed RNA polymerase subunit RPC12/RpoP
MAFDTYECRQCGETFTAFEDANAAQNQYCSPRCEVDGDGR